CAPITIVHARGTSEPGNVGAIAGPPFFTALQAIMGNKIAVQGVNNYPADVAGFIAGGSDTGAKFMADIVQQAVTSCNSTKIVMSGYSQGAQVVHKAAAQLSMAAQAKVMAIVTFGDPDNGQAFPGALNGREKSICRNGDLICRGLAIVQAAHLEYGQDAQTAAQFVQAQ
ncbi:cutinase, partial [Pyronema omphalodes]